MSKYGCDHIFIDVKELEKKNPLPDTIKTTNVAEIMTRPDYLKGRLLVCHYCGKRKEVWEDGHIIEPKNT